MEDFWEIAVPLLALFGSIALAVALLARLRTRARPEDEQQPTRPMPQSATRRQRKILAQFEPDPEIPTLMDMVKAEIEELGIESIPGGEGVGAAVLLKAYRRDRAETCEHEDVEFRVASGVDPADVTEDDVVLHCPDCAREPADSTEAETADDDHEEP